MESLKTWMESTWINGLVLNYAWTWPTLETLHFLGLCLLIGAILVMDLRLIGCQRVIPLSAVHGLMPIAMAGFVLNLVTGLGFIFGDPNLYFSNPSFQLKIVFVVLAGLNFLLYYFRVEPALAKLTPLDSTPPLARAVATASLVFWFGVLAYGRLLPYLGGGGG